MKSRKTALSAILEDYIETIFHIVAEKKVARGKEIAGRLKVSPASVTEALRTLSKKGLVNYAPYEVITLTARGRAVAADVVRRHQALKSFFTKVLGIEEEIAEQGACRIEHAAPPEIIEQLTRFMVFIDECPRGGSDFIRGFMNYCQENRKKQACRECLSQCVEGRKQPAAEK